VLECLHDSNVPMGITEIGRTVGLNQNMVFRLLKTLEKRKWVVQNDNCKYSIALRPFFLFAKSLSGNKATPSTWRNTARA
jgi:DNA-binding IclR family transcriptional regulator